MNMKNLKYIFTLLVMALIGQSLTGCSEDNLDTNQYRGGVSLSAWGPNPLMRGGTLRFVGSNLDQLQSITIPGQGEMTNFEVVKSGTPSEVRLVLDKNLPQVGNIILKAKDGTTITTQTQIAYIEGIELTGFEPAEAMPGQTITLVGDYLNLVQMVEFSDGVQVSVDDFVSIDRYKLQLVVPAEAKTGKVSVYTADLTKLTPDDEEPDYQIITSEKAFTVGLPTTDSADKVFNVKAGSTVTISGTTLSLIQAVIFGEAGAKVELTDFAVNKEGTQLSFTLPAEAPDGAINLLTRSEVEIPAGLLVTVAPTECVAAPLPVKAGKQLTITGKDLDVVTSVEFPNADAVAVEAAATITVTVPETAQEGSLTLRMANGKGVELPYTLVKPVVTGYSANPVSAGGELTLKGTDLDLVKSVTFGEAEAEAEADAAGTSLKVSVPMAAAAGKPVLNLKNGTTVEAPELSIAEALFCYITELPGEEAELKAGGSMSVPVANGDKLTGVQIKGEACQYVLVNNGTQLIVGIPEKAGKGSEVKLISSNGSISYTIDFIPNTEVTTVLWTGASDLAGWSWNWQIGDGAQGAGNPRMFVDMDLQEGDLIRVYLTAYNDWWQVQFFDGHWNAQNEIGNATGLNNNNNINSGIYNLDEHDGAIEIPVTATLKEQLTTFNDWGYCWILQGEGVVVTKITVTHFVSLETTLWQGSEDLGSWSNQPYILSDGGAELKELGVKAGQTIRCYGNRLTDNWQLQVLEGHWSNNDNPYGNWGYWDNSEIEANGCLAFTLTQEMIDRAYKSDGWGGVFVVQGQNFVITKITIE